VPLSGLYNTYNILAAVAAASCAGVPVDVMQAALREARPSFGRLEQVDVDGVKLRMMLAKNPAGFNEVLRASRELGEGRCFLIAINDRLADGRDVSWLWDVDFELLRDAEWIVVSGDRALDMTVRLKYAGVSEDAVVVAPTPGAALDELDTRAQRGQEVFVLPTYTAMLELRAELAARGYARQFWQAS